MKVKLSKKVLSLSTVFAAIVVLLVVAIHFLSNKRVDNKLDNLSEYAYEDSRLVIQRVREAAEVLEKRGVEAIEELSDRESEWFNENRYLFIYDRNGKCLCNQRHQHLEGRDLIEMRDINSKPLVRHIVSLGNDDGNGDGWVHYLWAEPETIVPIWKSSYIMRVEDDAGNEYYIGCGIQNSSVEKKFVEDVVEQAVIMLEENGIAEIDRLRDPATPYVFLDTYIFVLEKNGNVILDPAFPSLKVRNFKDIRDAGGRNVGKAIIDYLKNNKSGWLSFMWPRPGENWPSRKGIFVSKANVNGRELIVGSSMFLPKPIWMKGL